MSRRKVSPVARQGNAVEVQVPSTPQDEVASLREAVKSLQLEVEALKFRERVLLLSGPEIRVDGAVLIRCRCGKFSTRTYRVEHGRAGKFYEHCCDACECSLAMARETGSVTTRIDCENVRVLKVAQVLNEELEKAIQEATVVR